MCVHNLTVAHENSQGNIFFFWISFKIHYGSWCLCYEDVQELKNETNFSSKQSLDTLSCSTFCTDPPSKLIFSSHPWNQHHLANTTLPHQNICVDVCVQGSSSLSLSMAGLWQQLSSLRQGRGRFLLHFILYFSSGALPWDTKASPPTPEVRWPNCHEKSLNMFHT